MKKIQLREIERGDIPKINSWRNDFEVVNYLGSNFLHINEEIDNKWFDRYLADRDHNVRLAIVDIATKAHVGNVYLTSIHSINRSAEFSIIIGDKGFWSKGLGTEATALMLQHGFRDLNLERIYLSVLTENQRAQKVYLNLGFSIEGRHRRGVFKDGEFKDVETMAILRDGYKPLI